MSDWSLKNIYLKPVLWGVIGYASVYSLLLLVAQIPGLSAPLFLMTFYLVWSLLPAFVSGFCVGVFSTQRHFAHGACVIVFGAIVIGIVQRTPMALFTIGLSGMLIFVGVAIGKAMAPWISSRIGLRGRAVGRFDILALLVSILMPASTLLMYASYDRNSATPSCDDNAAVSEACAREMCGTRLHGKLRDLNAAQSLQSTNEYEALRELVSVGGEERSAWVVRGVVSLRDDQNSRSDSFRMYMCRVTDHAEVAIKLGTAESDRYPEKGSQLREAFEANWSR
jgi:hypothetical protein